MKQLIMLYTLLITAMSFGQSSHAFIEKADTFFKTYVADGLVNYKAIKADPKGLQELVALGKDVRVAESDRYDYQAFWINAYNVHVIDGIVAHYPVNRPLDITGFFDKTKREVGGKKLTLNDIENKLLRGVFPEEARFHFVLVCAGLGCPPIIPQAYTPEKLETQLQQQTTLALNNPSFIKVKGNRVQISQIFEWYKEDFTQNGDELAFINGYRKEVLPAKAKVSYYPYNWALNELK